MPKSIFLFIPAIFIVLLLAAISSNYQLTPKSAPALVSPTTIPTPTPAWQTYRNDQYGFEFQYPPSNEVEPAGGPVLLVLRVKTITVSVQNSDGQTLKEWLASSDILPLNNNLSTHVQESTLTVGGLPAIKITTPVNGGQETVYVNNDKYLYKIDFGFPGNPTQTEYDDNKAIFNQILSTFKFTNQKTNWKLFEHSLFSLKIPANWDLIDLRNSTEYGNYLFLSAPNLKEIPARMFPALRLRLQPGTPSLPLAKFTQYIKSDKGLNLDNLIVQEVTIDDNVAYKVSTTEKIGTPNPLCSVYIYKDNYLIEISLDITDETTQPIFDQILSTFKFIGQ